MEVCGYQCAVCVCVWGGGRGSSNSLTRNIRFPTGGYNLSNSKIIVLYVQLMLTHENVEFFGSEMVQNLLSVTVVITKHNSSIALPCTLHSPPPLPLYPTLAPHLPCSISLQKFTNYKFGAVDMKCSSILDFKTRRYSRAQENGKIQSLPEYRLLHRLF